MDAIRAQLAAISQEEADQRARLLAQMNDAQNTALATTFLSGVLGIFLTATVGILMRRATLARRRGEWLRGSGRSALA
jgi:CHASE3 domain sensor protein